MVAYDIGFLLLIKRLRSAYPDIIQPWYSDNAGALGMYDNLEQYFNSRNFNGPDQGYYPDPTKSILIVYPKNIRLGELFGVSHGFRV